MHEINEHVAAQLFEAADLLVLQGANPFRVSAYRQAAETVRALAEAIDLVLERDGEAGLRALPGIGTGIAAAIHEIVHTNRWVRLERLRGNAEPEATFQLIPGVGPVLAHLLHDELGVDTLEDLELAAHDGRAAEIQGIGARRAAALRAGLAQLIGQRRTDSRPGSERPSVETLLGVDDEYRAQAAAGRLARIAPRRFNPDHEAWLPVLHTDRGGWHFTALFSNSLRAHRLGRTGEWVVVYAYDDEHHEVSHTVVTERHGALHGLRVVRGREAECKQHYERRRGDLRASDQPAVAGSGTSGTP